MMVGDECCVLERGGSKRCGYIDRVVGHCVHVRHDDGSLSYHSPRALEAMRAVLDATEAVAKARDAVVEAAKALHATDPRDSYPAERAVRIACAALLAAERVEAEARARLEALR